MRTIRFAFMAMLIMPVALAAQAPTDTLSLVGRSSLLFGIGVIGTRDGGGSFTEAGAHATGEIASLSFNHWVTPAIAAEISTGLIGANATAGFGGTRTDAVMPVLFGLNVSPRAFALGSSLRPFVSLAAGPYIHTTADVGHNSATASSEVAPGARFGVGANLFVARYFMLAVTGDYNAVSRYKEVDAVSAHPSGFGMSLAFGATWGGR